MASKHLHEVRSLAREDATWTDVHVCVTCCGMTTSVAAELVNTPGLHVDVSDQVDAAARQADVIIGYRFPPQSLAGLPRLRWVHLTGTGRDHLTNTGLADDVLVTSSADVPVVAVAEYAISGLLMMLKELPQLARPQEAPWFQSNARLLAGAVVAVVGAGRIGRAVIGRLAALGASPVAVTRLGSQAVPGAARTIATDGLAREAPGIDHLIACLPNEPGTRALIGREVLSALRPSALVVNVGRAETVDNSALHDLLHAGQLGGAFIDVHEQEPLPLEHPVWHIPRLVVSPHRAFAFPDEPAAVARTFLDHLDRLRRGVPLDPAN